MATTPAKEKRSAGRPRDVSLDAAILEATRDVLAKVGYDRLTIDGVSVKAGIPRSTIYRRWRTKMDLVIDAVTPLAPIHEPPAGESLRDQLVYYFDPAHVIRGSKGTGVMTAIALALPRNPQLKKLWRDRFTEPVFHQLRLMFNEAIERGEISAEVDVETIISIIPAMIWRRRIFETEPHDLEWYEHIIDHIVMPLAYSAGEPHLVAAVAPTRSSKSQ